MWAMYTMEYYSALKREDILIHATTLMDLEHITLSDTSIQAQIWLSMKVGQVGASHRGTPR